MTSAIDSSKPTAGNALTADVRSNFAIAASEISALQALIGGGAGTVQSVAVTTGNGFSGSVSSPTTNPDITLSTTVSGVLKGSGGSLAAAAAASDFVAPSAYASANGLTMATAKLLGRSTAGTGAAEEITVGANLTLSGGTLSASASGTGTVTHTAGALTAAKAVIGNGTDDIKVTKITLTDPATAATLTLADNSTLTTSGAYAVQFTMPGAYTYTYPGATSTLAAIGVAQTWTAVQTFTNSDIRLLGSSTGYSTFTSANAGASNYTLTFPAITDTIVAQTTTDTLTNKNVKPRLLSAASYTTDTGTSLNCDNLDLFIVTAQAGALKFNNPTGTPYDGQCLWLAVTGTAARALTYDTQYESSANAVLPTTTVTTARIDIGLMWRADTSKWHCVGVA